MAAFEIILIYETWRPNAVLEIRWAHPQENGTTYLIHAALDLGEGFGG